MWIEGPDIPVMEHTLFLEAANGWSKKNAETSSIDFYTQLATL